MTTYNPTQEVQKTCLEIARRVTSVKNFIELHNTLAPIVFKCPVVLEKF